MYLWNPLNLGRVTAYVSVALDEGSITGDVGRKFKAIWELSRSPKHRIGTEVIVGYPFKFSADNIDDWKEIY